MKKTVWAFLAAMGVGASVWGADLPWPSLTLDAAATQTQSTDKTAALFDRQFFVTGYFENDGSFIRPFGTDKHYTSGEGFSVAVQDEWVRWDLPALGVRFDPKSSDTTFAAGFEAAQDIYTPADLSRVIPDPNDRPYAGWLYGGLFWQRAVAPPGHHAEMEHFQLDLGTIGTASLAEKTQKFVHAHIATNAVPPEGWNSQLHDEVGFDLTYIRRWRIDVWTQDQWKPALQVIPEAGITAGTIERNLSGGVLARAGWGYMPDDFGPGRMHEVAAFTGKKREGDFGIYIFGKLGGWVVEHNTFLEGNNYRNSPGQDATPLLGEFQAGLALRLFKHMELVYSQVLRTPEFHSQAGGDGFATLALTGMWKF